jgi:hypothetical protein
VSCPCCFVAEGRTSTAAGREAAGTPARRRDDSHRLSAIAGIGESIAIGGRGADRGAWRPKALGPPVGDPSALELVAPWRLPDRRARPPRPGAGGRVSGPLRRAMGYRRDADLGPRRDLSWPASAGVTTKWPAVRVHARGGGGGHPAGFPLGRLCLTQRRELRGRLNSLAHQLAERAFLRAAGGRRGEHVFGRLRVPSDGTRTLRSSVRQPAHIWLWSAEFGHRFLQPILHPLVPGGPPRAVARACSGPRR